MQILKTLLKYLNKRPSDIVAQVVQSPKGIEEFLGVGKAKVPTPNEVLQDINKVIAVSQSSDYAVWAKEVWTNVLKHMDNLCKPDLTPERVNFERGALAASLALLRLSYDKRNMEVMIKKQLEAKSRPTAPTSR